MPGAMSGVASMLGVVPLDGAVRYRMFGELPEAAIQEAAEANGMTPESLLEAMGPNGAFSDHPIIEMTWFGSRAYCEWRGGQLPTEAQWEKAARGTEGWTYPWGEAEPTCEIANLAGCVREPLPIGSHPENVSPYGAYDMAGNVWEWVNDWWDPEYYSYSPYENPTGPERGDFKVRRGGGYDNNADHLRTTFRYHNYPPLSFRTIGFRCAANP